MPRLLNNDIKIANLSTRASEAAAVKVEAAESVGTVETEPEAGAEAGAVDEGVEDEAEEVGVEDASDRAICG